MTTYKARIFYVYPKGELNNITKEGFSTVEDATEWLSKKIGYFMLHWAEIDPNGLSIVAEVYDGITFSDLYTLKCGL